jgi:hexosaminidase
MSPTSHSYFDYQPDHSTLKHTYFFNPVPTGITPAAGKRIKGIQANIWTEYIPTVARLDFQTMPRMVAMAEVAWTQQKDWNSFQERMAIHYSRLDALQIQYRLPDIPNLQPHQVFIDTARIDFAIPNGVTRVLYTTDGTQPDSTSQRYEKAFTVDSTTTIRLATYGAAGRSGNAYTIRYEKQDYLPGVTLSAPEAGLNCRYYQGAYRSVKQIAPKDFKKQTRVLTVMIPEVPGGIGFGLEFTGYINVPEKGIYTFYLNSDDGSALKIGGRMVVDNDGEHGDREIGGQIALDKGWHPIDLRFFDGGGGKFLTLQYEGPGVSRQNIPPAALMTERK